MAGEKDVTITVQVGDPGEDETVLTLTMVGSVMDSETLTHTIALCLLALSGEASEPETIH